MTIAEIESVIARGCPGPDQAKAFTRCGMGPCQGRMCATVVSGIFAGRRGVGTGADAGIGTRTGAGVDVDTVGHYRIRPPVKPITVGELAALEAPAPRGKWSGLQAIRVPVAGWCKLDPRHDGLGGLNTGNANMTTGLVTDTMPANQREAGTMGNPRKFASTLAAAALTASLATGTAPAADMTITVWAGGSNASDVYRVDAIEMAADILAREAEIRGESINVTVDKKLYDGWDDFKQAVTLAAESGNAPHIVVTGHEDIAPWANAASSARSKT